MHMATLNLEDARALRFRMHRPFNWGGQSEGASAAAGQGSAVATEGLNRKKRHEYDTATRKLEKTKTVDDLTVIMHSGAVLIPPSNEPRQIWGKIREEN